MGLFRVILTSLGLGLIEILFSLVIFLSRLCVFSMVLLSTWVKLKMFCLRVHGNLLHRKLHCKSTEIGGAWLSYFGPKKSAEIK